MPERPIDSTFNSQRTIEKRSIGGQQVDVVTELVIDTALPLVLTQDTDKAGNPNHQLVPESADLKVFGDEVTILGKLNLPGRSAKIFARTLRARADGDVQPSICVDGPELPKELAKPEALPKGESPPDKPTKIKVRKGKKGDDGYNERVQPFPLPHERMEAGKAGWSGPDHPGEMNGESGRDGTEGLSAGGVFIVCGETDFAAPLTLSAVGGPGGDGQPGQDGADGGDGGKGFDVKVEALGTHRMSTAGGDGGRGGTGGTGGRGGQGGDGGKIVVHSISNSPSIATAACDGGKGGAPGAGGKRGEKGLGGAGGNPGYIQPSMGPGRTIPGSARGKDGLPGAPSSTGRDAPTSRSSSASVTTGEVSSEALAKLASVSQLQMLFERVRAEYLVTEPQGYDLLLQSVVRAKDIVAKGRNLVVVAAVGPGPFDPNLGEKAAPGRLHIRVFDWKGHVVADKPETELAGRERVEALTRLKALKLNFAPAIEMTPRGVLLAGGWVKEAAPEPSDGWRRALIKAMIDNADLSSDDEKITHWGRDAVIRYYEGADTGVPERVLVNRVAMIALLLSAGVCDSPALQRMTLERQKRTLVSAIQKFTDQPEDQWSMRTQSLIEMGIEYCNAFRRDERVTKISEEDKQSILEDVALVLSDADCMDWYRLGGRLTWVVGILNKIPDSHSQKALASRICQSAWTALFNYNRGLDYYGKTPRFAPILSLDTYLTALESSLGPLKDIEEKAKLYFGSLRDQRDATRDLQAAIDQTDKVMALLTTRKNKILGELNETSQAINKFDSEQKSARQHLGQSLDGLKQQVKDAFGLSPETFFNCLFQLSFTNVHEPANKLVTGEGLVGTMGVGQAGAMAVSQLGLMAREAAKNVLDKSGEPINKNLILDQIQAIAEDADLKSEFTKRADGFLRTAGSARLIVELDKFRDLCKQFYGSLSDARAVRQELDSYIETITNRNRHIDYYNLLLEQLLDLSAEVDKLRLQKMAAQGEIAKKAQPGLAATATFVSGLYERAKAVCLWDFYHAYRAYAFWALEPYSGFYDKIGRNPDAINYDQLSVAKSDLKNDVLEALGNNYRTPNHFPAKEESEWSIGRVVVLTKKTHPDFFDRLEFSGEAEFELEPPTRKAMVPNSNFAPTRAAWCGSNRPDFVATQPNPFAGMADVRLTKVRVWLVGTENGLDHRITLTHLGQEQFRTPDDKPYPGRLDPPEEEDEDKRKPEYIMHEPVPIPFNYNAKGLRYDAETQSFTPGRLFGGVVGSQDGDLGFPKDGISDLPDAGKYAPVGPFGRWRLEAPENLNPQLDLSDLHTVVIDFHGFHQSFLKSAYSGGTEL
jgi:hypothetical protein